MMAEKEYISYEEINSECKKLAYILAGCGFKRIIAVARGGLVPACVLAQFLGIREISSISLASYEGEARSELKCLVPPDIRMDEETLFVDDLYDSGSTYRYLKEKFPNEYIDPHEAFSNIALTDRFPEMIQVLRQIANYKGNGIAAKLFYEGKVIEAISLIMEYNRQQSSTPSVKISNADLRALENGAAYINDHFNCDISVDQLSHITCMGRTKLKLAFKEVYGVSITEYIQQRRLSHAETLLSLTDFTIEQVAAAVGYNNAGRFASMFKKSTGVYPAEYRKMAQQK